VELHEAFHLAEMTVASEPNLLEILSRFLDDLEPVHCDDHAVTLPI
jgi:hypothetical protein